jgi:hypothetical protein
MSDFFPELYAAMLADQGLSLSDARIADAEAAHTRLRPGLEQLRGLELSFLEPVPEPATALRWLEAGATERS